MESFDAGSKQGYLCQRQGFGPCISCMKAQERPKTVIPSIISSLSQPLNFHRFIIASQSIFPPCGCLFNLSCFMCVSHHPVQSAKLGLKVTTHFLVTADCSGHSAGVCTHGVYPLKHIFTYTYIILTLTARYESGCGGFMFDI